MQYAIVGTLLGGRLGYFLLYQPQTLIESPMAVLRVWDGGMSSHGGMAGVAIGLAVFARRSGVPFLHVGDIIVACAPAGIFFVRVANFINGELWGKITTVPWAVIFPRSAPPGTPLESIFARHPSQLYEAFLEGLVLFAFMQLRFWKSSIVARQPGRLAGEFFLAYSLARIFCELFREPDEGISLLFGLSRGTIYSGGLLAAACFLLLYSTRNGPLRTLNPK